MPVLSRRYNFSPLLTSHPATSRCCVFPPALLPSETSFFLFHCCILSTSWSITVRLADGSRRFTCVVGLIGARFVTCFPSLSVSFHSLSRVSVLFNRYIQSPKTHSCIGSTRLLTILHTTQPQILSLSLFTSTKLSPINEGSFSQDPHSLSLHTLGLRLALPTASPAFALPVLYENGQHFLLRHFVFQIHRFNPESVSAFHRRLLLPVSFTTRFPNTLSLTAFPLLPLYRFHLVYIMHRLLYAPFAFRIHFDLVYPKHES